MDKVGPIFEASVPALTTAVMLLFVGAITQAAFRWVLDHMKSCTGNEWMIVLRNGEMVKCGVGLNTLVWPGDNVVVFPSTIHQVNFIA